MIGNKIHFFEKIEDVYKDKGTVNHIFDEDITGLTAFKDKFLLNAFVKIKLKKTIV